MQEIKIPILTYHSIDDCDSVVSTRPEIFRRQMKFLDDNAFNVICLKTLGERFSENGTLPPKTVVLTFDDGFRNFYTTAFPVLNQYNFAATVFLITDYCGKHNDWAGNSPNLARCELMDWTEIKDLSKHGIEFAAHSATHPDLTRLDEKDAEREMLESKTTVEDRLGVEAKNFAYPYGIYNESVKRLAEKHFKTACSTRLGKVQPGDDFFALKRLDAYYLSNERIFRSVLSANLDWYIRFREAMRDLKATCYNK